MPSIAVDCGNPYVAWGAPQNQKRDSVGFMCEATCANRADDTTCLYRSGHRDCEPLSFV
jgi:hypothetical protein